MYSGSQTVKNQFQQTLMRQNLLKEKFMSKTQLQGYQDVNLKEEGVIVNIFGKLTL